MLTDDVDAAQPEAAPARPEPDGTLRDERTDSRLN
jgi:hypothetical protein